MATDIAVEEQRARHLIAQETIDAIVQAIAERLSPKLIILFGSYASGCPTPDSDLDLLVVMDTDLLQHQRATPIRLLFKPVPCALDLLVYTPAEVAYWNGTVNHIITAVFQHGKIVYEQPAP